MIKLLHTSSSPHVRDQTDTTRIMIDVIIALMPATLYGIYQSGGYGPSDARCCPRCRSGCVGCGQPHGGVRQ